MPPGLTLRGIAACMVLAAAALLPLEPWAPSRPSGYALAVDALSDQPGLVQVYFDVGQGLRESDSSVQPILAGRTTALRLALPSGRYQGLRFDPLDRSCRMTLRNARIVDSGGATVVSFAPSQFVVGNEIRDLSVQGDTVVVETDPNATDPQLRIRLADAFVIPRPSLVAEYLAALAVLVCGLLALGSAWGRGLRARLRAWAVSSPTQALALAALAGTLAANYPVVFCGKSFVSPSQGVALLYGQSPWLPGFQGSEEGDPHKADVGALLWHHVPLSMLEGRAVFRDGELPLWNRYDSAGVPLLGQGQSCFGDPLHLIPILCGGSALSWDVKFLLAKALFGLAVGLCAWRAFRHLPSALLVSVSASFLGFYVYRIAHPAIFSLCYAPWILLCWLWLAETREMRRSALALTALIGANWAVMNSGTVKEAYMLLLSMNFSGLCVLLLCERPWRERVRLLGGAALAGVLFAMIGSPVWATFLRTLGSSYTSYNAPLAFQIQPGMLLGLFDEAFYRPFQLELGVVNPSANVFVLLGVLWCLVRPRALAANRTALALALSAVPALALVYGIVPPGLVARVPFLGNVLHVDNTFSCVLIVLLAVLSAFGWREAFRSRGTAEGPRDSGMVLGLLLLIFAAYLGTAQAVVRSVFFASTWGKLIQLPPFLFGYGLSLVLASAALLWVIGRSGRAGGPTPAAVLVGLFAFGAFHWREALQVGPGFSDYVVRPTARMDFAADSPAVDAMRSRADTPFRALGFHNDLFPGWTGAAGIEGITGPDALVNPHYRALLDEAGLKRVWDWRYIVEPADVPGMKPFLDSLGVRFYAGYHMGAARPGRELALVGSSDMDVYESAGAWPRAFFTDAVAVYSELPQFVSWIRSGDGRPFVAIESSEWNSLKPAPLVSADLSRRTVHPARDYHLSTNTTTFAVDASGPGFIVLTEAYEAGNVHAVVNGREARVVRVNHAFRGVYVEAPGTYTVTFSYWPRGLTARLIASGLGLALLAGALALIFLRPPGVRRAPAT